MNRRGFFASLLGAVAAMVMPRKPEVVQGPVVDLDRYDRLVLFHGQKVFLINAFPSDPKMWYMSRVNDPIDWSLMRTG